MRSMTGFGVGEGPVGAGKVIVEIRGVNHRFLDLRVRVPRELAELSGVVEQLARERLARGRYEVAVRTEGLALPGPVLDRERARVAYQTLCDLRDEIAPAAEVPLSLLVSLPDLYVSSVDHEVEAVRGALRIAVDGAVAALDEMRAREGAALRLDLQKRLAAVRAATRQVEARAPQMLDAYRRRLRERADRLRGAAEVEVDVVRLEQEIALFADRADVTEELTRLESHCAQIESLLATRDAVGRRLDFLLQEMAREANTVSAKSPDAQVSQAVVEAKVEIERMREQVQNVE